MDELPMINLQWTDEQIMIINNEQKNILMAENTDNALYITYKLNVYKMIIK